MKHTTGILRKNAAMLLALALGFQIMGCSAASASSPDSFLPDEQTISQKGAVPADSQGYTLGNTTLYLNAATGDLTGIDFPESALTAAGRMRFDAAYIDFAHDGGDGGWNSWGEYMRNTLFYQNLDQLNTYALPTSINYNNQSEYPRRAPENVSVQQKADALAVSYTMKPYDEAEITLKVETVYTAQVSGAVTMESTLTNVNDENVIINGAASVVSGLKLSDGATFEFPGNLPAQVYLCAGLPAEYSVIGEYASPLIHFMDGERDINLIFADEYEKWAPSVTMSPTGGIEVINLACAIDELSPGESLTLGKQFFQLTQAGGAYAAAQALYSANGWEAPTDGVRGKAVYSGHPAGVSDNDFQGAEGTLDDYQSQLSVIKSMGFDALWMLPVFEHPESGGSIYLPYNMEYVDARYSKRAAGKTTLEEQRAAANEEMAAFGAEAERVGLEFMIDYVPHGPYLYNKDSVTKPENLYDNPWLTEERQSWESMDRWWQDPDPAYTHWRNEWDCYAFDSANPDYLAYMQKLAQQQAEEFHLTGTRIDAVVGSLPNWKPVGDNRVSQTGLYGGAAMTKALRDGIKAAGKTPMVLPENGNLSPYYAASTDLFYDLPFYRVTLYSRQAGMDEVSFATTVAHWLKSETASSFKGMQFGRYLENHDTVAPWYSNFDGARAVEVYGLEKARAMWVLLSTIDGAPIIYQNDENGNEEFFTELLAMRKAQFGEDNGMDIEYYNDAASGIVAYRRYQGSGQKLVLVNLTDKEAARDFSATDIGGVRLGTAAPTAVYGEAKVAGDSVTLPAYGYVVLDLKGGEAFQGTGAAAEYLVTDVNRQIEEQTRQYVQDAKDYVSFELPAAAYQPAQVPNDQTVFDPVAEFSEENADGGVWKYLYYSAEDGSVGVCGTIEGNAGGVWRVKRTGDGDYDFEWAGCGRSTTYYPGKNYFELDANVGGGYYGLLTFVAPKNGTYTIPAFTVQGVGEAFSSILVVLKNGRQTAKSDMILMENGSVEMKEQTYELKAGDALSFYTARMDGKFSYFELDSMQIQYQPA